MVNIKQSSICFEVHVSTSLPGWIIGHPTSKKVVYLTQVISLDCLVSDQKLSTTPPIGIGRSEYVKTKSARSRDGSSCQKAHESSIYIWTKRSRRDQGGSYRAPYKYIRYRVKVSTRQHQFQPRLSLASTRVHLEEDNPPH